MSSFQQTKYIIIQTKIVNTYFSACDKAGKMICIFEKYTIIESDMKSLIKIALLSSVIALSLTACGNEKRCYCLETSDSSTYTEGKCCQINGALDIVETIFIFNPDGADLEFNNTINESHITFTDGLVGKRVHNAMKMSSSSIKVSIFGKIDNPDATFGYIKIRYTNYKALTERVREAYLYAYVAIGDSTGLVDKPADVQ